MTQLGPRVGEHRDHAGAVPDHGPRLRPGLFLFPVLAAGHPSILRSSATAIGVNDATGTGRR